MRELDEGEVVGQQLDLVLVFFVKVLGLAQVVCVLGVVIFIGILGAPETLLSPLLCLAQLASCSM